MIGTNPPRISLPHPLTFEVEGVVTMEHVWEELARRRAMLKQAKEVARSTKNVTILKIFTRKQAVCRAQIRACLALLSPKG